MRIPSFLSLAADIRQILPNTIFPTKYLRIFCLLGFLEVLFFLLRISSLLHVPCLRSYFFSFRSQRLAVKTNLSCRIHHTGVYNMPAVIIYELIFSFFIFLLNKDVIGRSTIGRRKNSKIAHF